MKQIIILLLMMVSLNAVSMQFNEKLNEPSITCPTKIICSKDKSISSCYANGSNLEYWGEIRSAGWQVTKGTYLFETAVSSYQSHEVLLGDVFSQCFYKFPRAGNLISITSKMDVNIEASPTNSDTTNWNILGNRANCNHDYFSPDPNLCKFDKIPLVHFALKTNNDINMLAYANGVLLTEPPISLFYNKLTLYQARDGCSDSGQCVIDFMINSINVGHIIVDMNNKMKILKTFSAPGSGYEFIMKEDGSTIEIKDSEL